MKLLVFALSLMFTVSVEAAAEEHPDSTISKSELDGEAKEVAEMEKQLTTAMEARDIPVLEKIIADHYFDTYEGEEKAMSKSDTIARCKAGVLNFLAIEKGQRISRDGDLVAVEGLAELRPIRVDDRKREEEWVRVRRMWTKKDGHWLLQSQVRRLITGDKKDAKKK